MWKMVTSMGKNTHGSYLIILVLDGKCKHIILIGENKININISCMANLEKTLKWAQIKQNKIN